MNTLRLALGFVLLCGACSHAPRTRTELDAARLAHAKALHVKERAPELFQKVTEAEAAAKAAGDDEATRADQLAIARLWLEAAIAECERADSAGARLVIEREIEGVQAQTQRDQASAHALDLELERRAAAQIAAQEIKRALERAALTQGQRPKLDKATETGAARALWTRAQLVIEAARALGASGQDLEEAQKLGDAARAALPSKPDVALDLADRALSRAWIALGPVRAIDGAVSDGEKQALREELDVQGAALSRDDRGLSASLSDMFTPQDRLSASAPRKLARLCALSSAHPKGARRFSVSAASEAAAARRREQLSAALQAAGCDGERMGIDARVQAGSALELTFFAY